MRQLSPRHPLAAAIATWFKEAPIERKKVAVDTFRAHAPFAVRTHASGLISYEVEMPPAPPRLYRGAPAAHRNGYSWTPFLGYAEQFRRLWMTGLVGRAAHPDADMWALRSPDEAILGYIEYDITADMLGVVPGAKTVEWILDPTRVPEPECITSENLRFLRGGYRLGRDEIPEAALGETSNGSFPITLSKQLEARRDQQFERLTDTGYDFARLAIGGL